MQSKSCVFFTKCMSIDHSGLRSKKSMNWVILPNIRVHPCWTKCLETEPPIHLVRFVLKVPQFWKKQVLRNWVLKMNRLYYLTIFQNLFLLQRKIEAFILFLKLWFFIVYVITLRFVFFQISNDYIRPLTFRSHFI